MKASTKTVIAKLAEVLLPVAAWVEGKGLPKELNDQSAWRADPKKASINDLMIPGFIESLLKADARDAKLRKRWESVAKKPLAFQSNLPGRAQWRKQRGLESKTGHVALCPPALA